MNLITLVSISKQQQARLKEWCKSHVESKHPKGVRDSNGAWLKYTIIPSGTGDNIEVECIYCNDAKIILTEGDDGDFLFDFEGHKTWCAHYQGKRMFQNLCDNPAVHIQVCVDAGNHMKSVDGDGDCKYCCHH